MTSVNHDGVDESPAVPRISVCVPMYNNGSTINRCLRSILDQDGVEFEIVIVDDQSTDNGPDIAATMLRAGDRLIRNQSRLGLNGNHNKCLELARGDRIQFVHGDDWLLPGALRTLSQYFEDPAVGLAFAPRRVLTDDLQWLQDCGTLHTHFRRLEERNHGPSLVTQIAYLGMPGNWIGEPTCVMFRRQLALDVGGFREDICSLVDLDLWLRVMLRSEVCFVPQELSVRSHTATTETKRIATDRRYWLDQLRVLSWMIVDPASPTMVRIMSVVWWFPVWLARTLETVIYGPDRLSRLKTLILAPVCEFANALRLRAAYKRRQARCR
nr:glycosyltransferase family 2 protein [Mycobacterium sp. E1386]